MKKVANFVGIGASTQVSRILRVLGIAMAIGFSGFTQQAAAAPNLIFNGGFESGTFAGWTLFGDQTFNGVQCPGAGLGVREGNCSAFFGPSGTTGGISQTLTLQAGQHYVLTFSLQPDGGTTSSFLATLGGTTLVNLLNPAAGVFRNFSFLATGTGAPQTLAFTFRDDPGFLLFDAVGLGVPEPSLIALFGIGLLALGMTLRRKV